jgi:hypothetical protein
VNRLAIHRLTVQQWLKRAQKVSFRLLAGEPRHQVSLPIKEQSDRQGFNLEFLFQALIGIDVDAQHSQSLVVKLVC